MTLVATQILRDFDEPDNVRKKYLLLKNAFKSYEMTKAHLKKYARNRLQLEREGALSGDDLTTWVGTEQEMREALETHEENLLAFTEELETLPEGQFQTLSPAERLECKNIQLSVGQTAASKQRQTSLPTRSAFDNGTQHGYKDGSKNKPRNYRPSLFKALLSESYRKDYIRGYNDGYRGGIRAYRTAELGLGSHSRNQSRER